MNFCEIVDFNIGVGDIVPTREQIATYVYTKDEKKVEDNSNLDKLEEFINGNRWSNKTIDDHSLVFLLC